MEEYHDGCRKAEDILHVLRDRVAQLPGSRDRKGRPVIVFPARECSASLNPDHIRNILLYLHAVTADDFKGNGFVIVIDMRKGTTWNNVKPILKSIQEYFPAVVHIALIIKPDNFWEKHKTSVSSGKYKFEVQLISVEGLSRFIDPSQLTRDLGGSFYYDHDEWLEIRLELEKLIWQIIDIMRSYETYRNEMRNGESPVDVVTAERAITAHVNLKKKINSASIDYLQDEALRIQQRISGSTRNSDEGYSSYTVFPSANPDLAAALPHLTSLVESLRSSKEDLFLQCEAHRQKLDHCYQLKLFEQDAEKMFEWTRSHYALSIQSFFDIGDSEQSVAVLIAEHHEYAKAASNTEVNVQHVMTVAKRLREIGNYGKVQIENVARRLEEEWHRFKQTIDQRRQLLVLSHSFHQKSHYYLSNFPIWLRKINLDSNNRLSNRPAEELEAAIAEHERFCETFLQSYAEAIGDGRTLSQLLKALGGDAMNQGSSYKYIVDMIQQITRSHKEIHSQWQSGKLRLHSRLALIAFETDTHRVLQWLEQHGDAYLNKNTAIGNNLSQAKVLQRNHTHFRSVASNTYNNAEKLFTASNTIIESGECDVKQMSSVVEELRRRIQLFSSKVEARHDLLNKSVLFHTHYTEIMDWYERMEMKSVHYEQVSTSIQDGERRKEEWMIESDATAQAYGTTMSEGHQLIKALEKQAQLMKIDNSVAVLSVERLIGDIEQRHAKLAEIWPRQRNALQLGVRFAIFLRDCKQIRQQLKNWQEDMLALVQSESFYQRAEHILPYQEDNTTKVKKAVMEIMSGAAEFMQALEGCDLSLITAEGVPLKDVVVANSTQLSSCQREVMQVAQETRRRIEHCMQLSRANGMAVCTMQNMQSEEQNLLRDSLIPSDLDEALSAQVDHRHFQHAIENINHIAAGFIQKMELLISAGGVDARALNELSEQVMGQWRRLVGLAEERNKLIKAAIGCYKTLHQGVMPILDQLEKDYSMESVKDWCALNNDECAVDRAQYIAELLSKHMEYKERFLKGCSYAQKTSELFLKYIRRCEASVEHIRLHETRLMNLKADLRERQMKILDLWTQKKQQLDRCQQFVLLTATIKQNMDWISQKGDCMLNQFFVRDIKSARRDQLEHYIDEYATFKIEAKQKRVEVSTVLKLAEAFCGSTPRDQHVIDIEFWNRTVREKFEQFSSRLAEYEKILFSVFGRNSDVNKAREELSLDRQSDSSLDAKVSMDERASEANRKMREPMMELIKSEKDYVDDLFLCINKYLFSYRKAATSVSLLFQNKEQEIFGNIEELYKFHSETFLPELIKYENEPEDVGYCFIFAVEMLNSLYTEYCVNKEQNNHLIALPEVVQFFSELRHKCKLDHSHDLQSLLIKPVQRITRYRLMLEQLLKNCKNNVEEIKEAYDVVVSVPRRANDLIHLRNLEGYQNLGIVGEFVMQESFVVWDSKAYFKKGRERQVFLFELCVVFAKRIELYNRGYKYISKHRLMLSEINVCEHVEGDPSRFALRQGAIPNSELRIDLKGANEQSKMNWVKKIRELMQGLMTANLNMRDISSGRMPRPSTCSMDSNSRDGDSLPAAVDDKNPIRTASTPSVENQSEYCVAIEDYTSDEVGRLSITKGQLLQILDFDVDASDALLVSTVAENGEQVRGLVPFRILSFDNSGCFSTLSSTITERPLFNSIAPSVSSHAAVNSQNNSSRRKSLKRFFTSQSSSAITTIAIAAAISNTSSSANLDRPSSPLSLSTQLSGINNTSTDLQQTLSDKKYHCITKNILEPTSLSSKQQLFPSTSTCVNEKADSINSDIAAVLKSSYFHSSLLDINQSATTTPSIASSCPLTIRPIISESTIDHSNLLLSEQSDFDLPPPMSDLSTAIVSTVTKQSDSIDEGESNKQNASMLTLGDTVSDGEANDNESEIKSAEDTARMKRKYVLMELVGTERDYVKDLSSVVEGYMANLQNMELPENLIGKDKIIFANIAQILDFHKTLFLKEIEKCLDDYEFAGSAFVKYERRLHTYYVKYCQNKPKSDFLMAQDDFEQFFAEIKQKLGHKVALCDLLIKPVQRIMKYQLLLKDVMKYTERANDPTNILSKAQQVMHVVPKACDDMMQVGRLQNFDGNLNAQGKLIYQGTIAISDNAPSQVFKAKDRRIFLFEQSLIIADCILPKKEFSNPTYIFRNQIMVNKMVLEANVPDEPLRFIVRSNDPTQPNSFLALSTTMEEKNEWINKINSQLDQQRTLLAALVDPKRYQNQLAGAMDNVSIGEGASEKKKPIFSRLTGKSKENLSSSTAESSGHAHSPKHNSSTKKLFGFGKKTTNKAAVSPPPSKVIMHRAQLNCSFKAIRSDQINGDRGDKVKILEIHQSGNAKVEKENGEIGYIPTYFLEIDSIPGDNFADQIQYRREWYEYVDHHSNRNYYNEYEYVNCAISANADEIHQIFSNDDDTSRDLINENHQPKCNGHLRDINIRVNEKFELNCSFLSNKPFTITWRGPAINQQNAKNYFIKNDIKNNLCTLLVYNCKLEDSGQYWVEAENEHGKEHTVSWVNVYVAPGFVKFTKYIINSENSIKLYWLEPYKGNSKLIWYTIEYKSQDSNEYEVAIQSTNKTSIVINNLNSNVVYSFRIFAFNELIRGDYCKPIDVIISDEVSRSFGVGRFYENLCESIEYINLIEMKDDNNKSIYTLHDVLHYGRYSIINSARSNAIQDIFIAKSFAQYARDDHNCKLLDNFENEIRILRSLNHPNIVKYICALKNLHIDDDDCNCTVLYIMNCGGVELFDYLINLGYLSELLLRNFVRDLLNALKYLQYYQLVHLDITPENLVVKTGNSYPCLILIDFGSCCQEGMCVPPLTTMDVLDFVAPELMQQHIAVSKSDIWSMGVLLHILVCGNTPFEAENRDLMVIKISNGIVNTQEWDKFESLSLSIISFLNEIFVTDPRNRPSANDCLQNEWICNDVSNTCFLIDYLEEYNDRRKVQLKSIAYMPHSI